VLPNGWTIVAYHDVDPDPSPWRDWIGVHVTPSIFRGHVATFARHAELIDVSEGLRRLREEQEFEKPYLSFWFDDGYRGVREHALPILDEFGVSGAQAVNSRFAKREELFWRCKMAKLYAENMGPVLEAELEAMGCPKGDARNWTLQNFQMEILEVIDTLLANVASEEEIRSVTDSLFDDRAGLTELLERGWVLGNHTAAHYPVMEREDPDSIRRAYGECESWLGELGVKQRLWVVPFDPGHWKTDRLGQWLRPVAGNADIIRLQWRTNTLKTYQERHEVFRYMVWPPNRTDPLPLPEGT